MKKTTLTVVLLLSIICAFGQKKAVNRAFSEAKMEKPNFQEARDNIKGALTNPESKDDAKTWYVAGFVENAFYETQKELKILYPPEARISKELLVITRKLRIHIPVEQVLEEFAEQVLSEDVKSFVTVFVTAKKSGGDMIGIIRNTANQIGDKIEVKREIDTMLAAKKYEFQIMSVVPYGIIGYMSLSFPEFMNELYGNMAGIGVMTLCLGIYAGAYYLGIRILRIDV